MSEKNVTLISKNYAENVFVTEPQLQTELSKKQDNVGLFIDDDGYVSTGTGIKQYGMTSINYFEGLTQFEAGAEINSNTVINGQITQSGMIYENYFEGFTRFESVKIGTAELGDTEIKGEKPVLNITSQDGSVTVTRDPEGYGVDLKASAGGSIDENRVITGRYETFGYGSNRFIADSKVDAIRLGQGDFSTNIEEGGINVHSEDGGVNADITIQAFVSAFTPGVTISIPCDEYGGYTSITSNGGTEVMRFEHDTSAGYDVHNTKIYFKAPIYDKDGNEISGEVKSDTWYCKCLTQDMGGVGFKEDNIDSIPGVIQAWSWGHYADAEDYLNAKLLFEKPMSLLEVNNALCHFEMWSGPIFTANDYYAFAMCPMDDELEAMIPSYAVKIK